MATTKKKTPKHNPRLHELLAVEQDRKQQAERARRAAIELFTRQTSRLSGMRRTFRPFAVDEDSGETAGERLEAQTQLVTTVPEQLREMLDVGAKAMDVGLQIDEANTRELAI